MQCSSCRAVYSNGLDICPRCKTQASKPSAEPSSDALAEPSTETTAGIEQLEGVQAAVSSTAAANEAAPVSTLIEFPGVSRNKPQWRKDLSERVREIQERRARESVAATHQPAEQLAPATQLGLVPQPDAPAVHPLVVKALKRIERAHRPTQPVTRTRSTMGGAATAVARVAEEQYQTEERQETELAALLLTEPQTDQLPEEKPAEAAREREHTLVVVPPSPAMKATAALSKAELPASMLALNEESLGDVDKVTLDATPGAELYDDRAPVVSRVVGSLIDLLVVAFASSPFAAIIELTNGNWSDKRVMASMGGIVLTIMFLYLAASTALAGRTWGMSLLSIRAVDAESSLPPTTRQSVGRALLYIFSLALLGVGILYALFDAESRTAHDHFSGTIVVRE